MLEKLACSKNTDVDQILVEFHFQKQLGIPNKMEFERAVKVVECLHTNWVRTRYIKTGAGPLDWDYVQDIYNVLPTAAFLTFQSFRQLKVEEGKRHILMNKYVDAVRARVKKENSCPNCDMSVEQRQENNAAAAASKLFF